MKPIPEETVKEAVAELDRVRASWLRRPGVTAVDVGYRIVDGEMRDELAVRVHVKRKLPPEELAPGEAFPESLGAFPVSVLEVEYEPQAPAAEALAAEAPAGPESAEAAQAGEALGAETAADVDVEDADPDG